MELGPVVADRVRRDGYRFGWRVSQGTAMSHTLAREPLEIPVDEFITRYFCGTSD